MIKIWPTSVISAQKTSDIFRNGSVNYCRLSEYLLFWSGVCGASATPKVACHTVRRCKELVLDSAHFCSFFLCCVLWSLQYMFCYVFVVHSTREKNTSGKHASEWDISNLQLQKAWSCIIYIYSLFNLLLWLSPTYFPLSLASASLR